MEFFDVIDSRHSIRAFAGRPLEAASLQQILSAASLAPSAGNLQAFQIYQVQRADLRSDLAEAASGQMFVAAAPTVLVFAAHPQHSAPRYGRRGIKLYALQDATIACTFAMLAATALGIGSVWVGAFSESAVQSILDIPETIIPVALLCLGYPAESPERRPRRALADLVHRLE